MSHKVPTLIRGVLYDSIAQAARELNVPTSAIYLALENGTIDHVGLGRNYKSKVRLESLTDQMCFGSIVSASEHYGIPASTLRSKLRVPGLKVTIKGIVMRRIGNLKEIDSGG